MWKFEEGIVSNQLNTYTNLKQRIYHVRYLNGDGDLRRVISASLVFVQNGSNKTDLKEWAEAPDDAPYASNLSFVSTLSKVASIMDFRASEDGEEYDPASNMKMNETQMEEMVDGEDEDNYLHRGYFEKYIKEAGIDVCLCSSRNDEEATKRLAEMNFRRL